MEKRENRLDEPRPDLQRQYMKALEILNELREQVDALEGMLESVHAYRRADRRCRDVKMTMSVDVGKGYVALCDSCGNFARASTLEEAMKLLGADVAEHAEASALRARVKELEEHIRNSTGAIMQAAVTDSDMRRRLEQAEARIAELEVEQPSLISLNPGKVVAHVDVRMSKGQGKVFRLRLDQAIRIGVCRVNGTIVTNYEDALWWVLECAGVKLAAAEDMDSGAGEKGGDVE